MGTIIVIAVAWIAGSVIAGLGVGRMIARADTDGLEREHRELLAATAPVAR